MYKNYMDILAENDISSTTQRVMILEFLDKNRIHPTADEIYEGLKKVMISISKATVYNTLNNFVKNGLIHELKIFENESRYEYNKINHIHFKCIKCGKIYDINEENSIYKTESIDNHKILDFQINLKGICKNCLEEEDNN